MPQDALVTYQLGIGKLGPDEGPGSVAGIVAKDLGKELAEGRGGMLQSWC